VQRQTLASSGPVGCLLYFLINKVIIAVFRDCNVYLSLVNMSQPYDHLFKLLIIGDSGKE